MGLSDMTERKLATVCRVANIEPIPDADAIDVATIDGWKVVVKKGDFQVGDLAVYFEIDSWIPKAIAPFLNRGRTYNGVEGERLRTVKLRKQISQGLLLPMSAVATFDERDSNWYFGAFEPAVDYLVEGDDLTDELAIQKYEKPIHGSLAGVVKGNFPSFLRKTDQERVQNLTKDIRRWEEEGARWEVTEKLDGSSMTVYMHKGVFGVCSRNYDLEETEGNTFWQVARRDLDGFIPGGYAVQGELVGPGIQGNKYGLSAPDFYIFDVWDIREAEYLEPWARREFCKIRALNHVPVLEENFAVSSDVDGLLATADGQSVIGNKSAREGLVFKNVVNPDNSFKAISNKWLLKNEE
jgi:RNA ligase (TIGR02306 family)